MPTLLVLTYLIRVPAAIAVEYLISWRICVSAIRQRNESDDNIDRQDAFGRVRNLLPLKLLSDRDFATITAATNVESCARGHDLFRAGFDDNFIFFLLSGTIAITDAEGESFNIVGGEMESRYPLSPQPPDRIKATARSPAQFIRFPADLLRLQSEGVRDNIKVEEINQEADTLEQRALFEVFHGLMNDDLVLPSLPDVAIRIRDAANNENVAVEDIARIIRADASTAAYCIGIANNAAFAGAAQVDNILDAVVRMGIQPTRDLVVAYTIRSLFTGKDPLAKKLMREAWVHSCRIAALSYILARDVGRLNPERALLAGLLHDVGVTVLINEAQTHPPLLKDMPMFCQLCQELSGQIGAMILRAWKFPDIFATAALEAEAFTKAVGDRLNIGDIVVLAHLHDRQPAPWSVQPTNLGELAIYSKLNGYDTIEDHHLAVVEAADRELVELTALLSS